jgi:hypothetical protein
MFSKNVIIGIIAPKKNSHFGKKIHKKILIPIHLKQFLKPIINQNHYGEKVSKVNT